MASAAAFPGEPKSFRVTFPSDLRAARDAAGAVRAFLAKRGVTEPELFACETCAMEACYNAVEYATGPARARPPAVEAICRTKTILLRVTDHTSGFTWPEKIVLPPPTSERGRGLFIIQSTMDEISYRCGENENVLCMSLRRGSGSQPVRLGSSAAGRLGRNVRGRANERNQTAPEAERERSFRSEALAMVADWSAELARPDERGECEARLLEELARFVAADWYVLRLATPDLRELMVVVSAATEPKPNLPVVALGSAGLEAAVAASRTAATFDARRNSVPGEALRAFGPNARGMVYPLTFGDTLVGTLALGGHLGDFAARELPAELPRILAAFLAMRTLGQHRREEELRGRLVARELEIGRKIQQALLPAMLPDLPGFGLSGGWQSAREIGGDFYDAVALSDHSVLLIMADVMGKGVPAALFASHVRGILRGLSVRTEDPAQLLNRLNRLLHPELSAVAMFVTALVVVVDLKNRQVAAASAGHCPPLFVPRGRRTIRALEARGMPLGIFPDTSYQSERATLGKRGLLFLHTDGLTEARNPAGEMFGQERMMRWLNDHAVPGRSATELRGRLLGELNDFRGGRTITDDQTFLLLAEESA